MELTQLYETTIVDPGRQALAHVLVAPARSLKPELQDLPQGGAPQGRAMAEKLGLSVLVHFDSPSRLPYALLGMLLSSKCLEPESKLLELMLQYPGAPDVPHDSQFAFVEHVTFTDLIPFEASSIRNYSLANIMMAGAGAPAAMLVAMRTLEPDTAARSTMMMVPNPNGTVLVAMCKYAREQFALLKRYTGELANDLLGVDPVAVASATATTS